jgi:hypothetical protein
MELPAEVLIHNETLGAKGSKGTLIQINPNGYYEVNCYFGDKLHRTFFPVIGTVLVACEPEVPPAKDLEIER